MDKHTMERIIAYADQVVDHWESCPYAIVSSCFHEPEGVTGHFDPYVHCPAYEGYILCDMGGKQELCQVLEHDQWPYAIEARVRRSRLWPQISSPSLRIMRDEYVKARVALYHFEKCLRVRSWEVSYPGMYGMRFECLKYKATFFTHVLESGNQAGVWYKKSCFLDQLDVPLARTLIAAGVVSMVATTNWWVPRVLYPWDEDEPC